MHEREKQTRQPDVAEIAEELFRVSVRHSANLGLPRMVRILAQEMHHTTRHSTEELVRSIEDGLRAERKVEEADDFHRAERGADLAAERATWVDQNVRRGRKKRRGS